MIKQKFLRLRRRILQCLTILSAAGATASCGDDKDDKVQSAAKILETLRQQGLINSEYAVGAEDSAVCGICNKK